MPKTSDLMMIIYVPWIFLGIGTIMKTNDGFIAVPTRRIRPASRCDDTAPRGGQDSGAAVEGGLMDYRGPIE
jgi:hypothetical protein